MSCPICHCDFESSTDRCTTACGHEFHTSCLFAWGKYECPLCRSSVLQPAIDQELHINGKSIDDQFKELKDTMTHCETMKQQSIELYNLVREYYQEVENKYRLVKIERMLYIIGIPLIQMVMTTIYSFFM